MRRRSLLQGITGGLLTDASGFRPLPALTFARSTNSTNPEMVRPDQILIVYRSGPTPEDAAAAELARYIQRMTGKQPDLIDEAKSPVHPGGRVLFLVGRTAKTAELIQSGKLNDPVQRHKEAYQVNSLRTNEGTCVIFLGATAPATLYAVYHYLEETCGAGFYWDGDCIPVTESVPVRPIAIETQPYFSERIYGNGCLWFYTGPWWHWKQWRRHIDWAVKKRFNTLFTAWSPGANAVWDAVWASVGIKVPDEEWAGPPYDLAGSYAGAVSPPQTAAWRNGRAEMQDKIVRYARSRGLRLIAPGFSGLVPKGFRQLYPNVTLVQSGGISAGGSAGGSSFLQPWDPMYRQVCVAFLERYNKRYGTDHIYHLGNLSEMTMVGSQREKEEYAVGTPLANFRAVKEIDSRATCILDGWTFLGRQWSFELIKRCIQQFPQDQIRVMDFWAEQQPLHKATEYFWGAPWQFGVLNSFAGDTHLHGDVALLEKQLRGLSRDARARGCTGFALVNEVSGFNHFYFDFAAKLGWNPAEVALGSFVQYYAARRYGQSAAPHMEKAFDQLLATVYGPSTRRGNDSFARPLYWGRLGKRYYANICDGVAFIPRLRRAVEVALEVPECARNGLYLHDLNDIARAYLHQVFNARTMELLSAFKRLDSDVFEDNAALLDQVLEAIEKLLKLDEYYWLTPLIRLARTLPGSPPDIDRRVRDVLTLWDGRMHDYACLDRWEMVRGYYRPRVRAFLDELRRELRDGQRSLEYQPGEVRLEARYDEIERQWVSDGCALAEGRGDPRLIPELIRKIMNQIAVVDSTTTTATTTTGSQME